MVEIILNVSGTKGCIRCEHDWSEHNCQRGFVNCVGVPYGRIRLVLSVNQWCVTHVEQIEIDLSVEAYVQSRVRELLGYLVNSRIVWIIWLDIVVIIEWK